MILRRLVSFTAALLVAVLDTCFALKASPAAKDGGDATFFIQQNVAPRQPFQSPGRLSTKPLHTLAPKISMKSLASDLSSDPILTDPIELPSGDDKSTLSQPLLAEDEIEDPSQLQLPALSEVNPLAAQKKSSRPPASKLPTVDFNTKPLDIRESKQDPADAMHDWEYWRRFAEHVIREKKGLQTEVQSLKQNFAMLQEKNSGLRKNQQDLQQAINELRSRINDEESQWALQLQNAEVQHGQENRDLRDHAKKYQHENAELQAKYTRLATQAKNLQLHLQAVEEDKEDVEGSALKFKEENKRLLLEFQNQQDAAKQALKLEEDMASEIYQLKEAKVKLQAMYADCRSKTLSRHETVIAEAERSVEDKRSLMPTKIELPKLEPPMPAPEPSAHAPPPDSTMPDIDPPAMPPSSPSPAPLDGGEKLPIITAMPADKPSPDPQPGVLGQ